MLRTLPALAALLLLASPALPLAPVTPLPTPAMVPEAAEGFVVSALLPVVAATALAFGPGGADGPDLYATTLLGDVVRMELVWTPAGPVPQGLRTHASGFGGPLGLWWVGDDLYVADSHDGTESGRTDGRVWRVRGDEQLAVVDGLPNGRHNTNHLRPGPDGRFYITNGNPNDNGIAGGDADVFPYSGAVLSVDLDEVGASPAVLRWRDAQGNRIPEAQIATHPVNADFASKVHVLGWGFRNVFGVAFGPHGAYTGMNGADSPDSQDSLHRIVPGADHGFPFCYNRGPAVGVGAEVRVVPNPVFNDTARCVGIPPATALLGWHTCATGLDLPNAGPWQFPGGFRDSVYVGECGPLQTTAVNRIVGDPANATHNTGHKVRRVALDASGEATEVRDFLSGLVLPTDVLFGPDGAMYVADAVNVYRIAGVLP